MPVMVRNAENVANRNIKKLCNEIITTPYSQFKSNRNMNRFLDKANSLSYRTSKTDNFPVSYATENWDTSSLAMVRSLLRTGQVT